MGSLLIAFLAVLAVGFAILTFGPIGWRTHILGAIVAACPVVGELLNYVGGVDWSAIGAKKEIAAGIGLGVGALIIVFNFVNKRLYGAAPKA